VKYKIGDVIKTINFDRVEHLHPVLYCNKIGIVTYALYKGNEASLYEVILSGIENKKVWLSDKEIEKKLD
jgi:hypothetical protein